MHIPRTHTTHVCAKQTMRVGPIPHSYKQSKHSTSKQPELILERVNKPQVLSFAQLWRASSAN